MRTRTPHRRSAPPRGVGNSGRRCATRSTRRRAALRLVAAGLLVAGAAVGGDGNADPGRARAIRAFVRPFVDLGMFDGAVLVDIGGEVVYDERFGLAHYELGMAHRPTTRFLIASISKTLTDAAVAVMVQNGRLQRTTPLARYLPEFPSAEVITIGHLLDHSSGVPHVNDLPWGDGETSLTLDEIVARLGELPLDFPPGTDSSYSNGGYALLARILEIVGEGSYGEVMRDTLFRPLGMADTGHVHDSRAPILEMATGYEPGPYLGERRRSRFYAVETRPGGGSLYSTPRDLLAFTRAVFRDRFITAEVARDILGVDGEPFLAQGRSPGFVAKIYFDPTRDLIVVSTANSYAVPAGWAATIADLATGTESAGWPTITPATVEVPEQDPRIGDYENSFGGYRQTIERSDRGALLLVDARSRSRTGLIPLTDGSFVMPLYFQRCEQDTETRTITCRMLSGDPRYTSTLTPVRD